MYKNLLETMEETIKHYHNQEFTKEMDEQNWHYFIQGLKVAVSVIEQTREVESDVDELAYETFEEIFDYYSEILDPEDFQGIISRFEIEED